MWPNYVRTVNEWGAIVTKRTVNEWGAIVTKLIWLLDSPLNLLLGGRKIREV